MKIFTLSLTVLMLSLLISDLVCSYETDSIKTGNYGEIEIIHFEPREFIVAGTFKFTVVTEDCDTIRVSEGRFDVNYNAI